MQITTRLDNVSIFVLAEKRMAGIVHDWWIGPPEAERQAVMAAGISTLEVLLKTQFVPEPIDEKKQIVIDLTRMELKDLKFLGTFGQDFMAKVYKTNLSNDSTRKVAFISKILGNLRDLIFKGLKIQGKSIDQIYWIDLLLKYQEKVKYLCWEKQEHDIMPSAKVYRTALPWTPFRKGKKTRRYDRFKPKRVANPEKPFKNFRFLKERRQPRKNNNCCFVCKQEGHFARRCPNSSSNKFKACVDIEEFLDDWSVVESQEDLSDVYILIDASLTEEEENVEFV